MNPRERKYHEQGWRHGRDALATGATDTRAMRDGLVKAFRLPEDEAARCVVADYERRLDSLPPLAEYPELKGMRECVVAYDRGMAEGSGMSLTDVIIRANFLHAMTDAYRISSPSKKSPAACEPGCTLVYFPRSDRGPLMANNNDGLESHKHHQGPWWIESNHAGLMVGCVSSGIFDDEVSPQQFPAPIYLMVDEMCGTASEAVDLLTRLNLFWGPCNALVADRQGNSAVIEKSSCRYGVRKSANGFSAITEMSAEEPKFKTHLWETRERSLKTRGMDHGSPDWAYWKACERRSARLQQMIAEAAKAPTYEKMEAIIYNHTGSPDQVHMDGSKCHPDQEAGEWSLRTIIWIVNERRANYSFAEPPVSGHLTPRQTMVFENVDHVF